MKLRIASALAVLVAAAAAGSTSASVGAVRIAACGTIPGPAWVFGPTGEKGNTYKVTARGGVACSFARSWASKLVKTPYRGEAGTHLTGPAGWSCLPTVSWGHGTPGECAKGKTQFSWGINAKSKL